MNLSSTPTSRRDALKLGGVTISLGALIAACGEDRGGDDAPGRVGNAPATTEIPDYAIDQAALLRTASSLEYTAVEVYTTALDAGFIPDALTETVETFVANHQALADRMVELTEAAGGEAWTCSNPWLMERLVGPVLAAITEELVVEIDDADDYSAQLDATEISEDVIVFAAALENLAQASHQSLASAAENPETRVAHIEAATLEGRQAAIIAIAIDGESAYVTPALLGEDVAPDARGNNRQFAVSSRFGQTGQIEIKAGPPDQNGVRETFVLQTPAANSIVYNELSCDA